MYLHFMVIKQQRSLIVNELKDFFLFFLNPQRKIRILVHLTFLLTVKY